MVDHKYNTRFKNEPNHKIYYESSDDNDNSFNKKEFSKFLYQQFPSKYSFNKMNAINNLDQEISNKKKNNPKNKIKRNKKFNKFLKLNKKQIKNQNDFENKKEIRNNNDFANKKIYFNRLKRQCCSPLSSDSLKKNKKKSKINLDKEENENIIIDNKPNIVNDYDENKKFNIFIDYPDDEYLSEDDEYLSEEDEDYESDEDNESDASSNDESKSKNNNLVKEYKNILKEDDDNVSYFKSLEDDKKLEVLDKLKQIKKNCVIELPYEIHMVNLDIEEKYKSAAFNKLSNLNKMSKDKTSSEYIKLKIWIDNFMKIPFNNYCNLPITINDGIDKCKEYILNARKVLDEATYGLTDAKFLILQFLAELINNPESNGIVVGIKGPMGTGKTTLVKDGISKILNRPFQFLPLAGIQDGSYLDGHSYTYDGSKHGKIVDILIQTKCMNPIIYGDELDKVSGTSRGDEIIGLLTHLTDTTQSSEFNDKYFSEINFNLNKVIYIFSYNDEENISPILRDRMYKIETKGYSSEEKLIIAKKYLIPKIIKDLNSEQEIELTDENIKYIINNFTNSEDGVRNLKRCLETIYKKINLYKYIESDDDFKETYFKDIKVSKVLCDNTIEKLLGFMKKTDTLPFGMYN